MPSDSAAPPLAQAFLALGDAGDAPPVPPSPVMVLAAMAAALVIALSAPLAWAATPLSTLKASHQLAATPASKAAVPAPDDDGDDGGA